MNELVSIVGFSYFHAISALLEKLQLCVISNNSQVQVESQENGLASSVCLLSAVCLESYVMRSRYVKNAQGHKLNKTSVVDYLSSTYSDYELSDVTTEIFVTRDAIAHNHLFITEYELDNAHCMSKVNSTRISSGDNKLQANTCSKSYKTTILGLNTNPALIGMQDAKIMLSNVWENLLFLENQGTKECHVSHLKVSFNSESISIGDMVLSLGSDNSI